MVWYIGDDATRWGTGTGVPHSRAKMDDNAWDADSRLKALEANAAAGIFPTGATISGTDITFLYSDPSANVTLPFPVLTWKWRDVWLADTLYAKLDWFIVNGIGLFLVLLDHVSDAAFDEAATSGGDPLYRKLLGFSGLSGAFIADLIDVAIAAATDKNFFVYDLAAGKWKNVTKTVATSYLDVVVGDSGSGGTKGLVPAPSAGDAAAGKVLSADGSWVVPPSGASATLAGDTDVNISAPTNNDLLQFKTSDGQWHNTPLSSIGGTVTTVIAGTGISTGGADITITGTVSLASVADNRILANVSGASAAPTPVTLTAILDHVAGSDRGSIIRRDATGWSVLGPGTSGQYLKSGGAGVDVAWDSPAGSGTVTSVAAGTGLAGGTITGSGSLSIDTIADSRVLANISGSTGVPSAATVSNLIDHCIGSTRGAVLYRGASGWAILAPGTSGYVFQSGGAGADPGWAVSSSSSLAGESDTTVSSPADKDFLIYDSGTSKWVNRSHVIATSDLDAMVGDSGSGGTKGLVPAPGAGDTAAAKFLKADGTWAAPAGTGVSSVATGTGLTGGTITSTGTVSLATVSTGSVLANISGSTAAPSANTLSGIIDSVIGSTRGAILYRGSGGWTKLDPGTSGRFLRTSGTGTDPAWSLTGIPSVTNDLSDVNSSPGNTNLFQYQTSDNKWHAVQWGNALDAYLGGSSRYQMIRRGSSAGVWQAEDVPFVVPAFVSGVPAASYLYAYVAAVPIFFAANFSGSRAKSQVAATGNTDIDVLVNGSSIGTITFGFGDAVASFVTAGGTSQSAGLGDIITFTFPGSPDATLADIAISLKGLLQ